MSQPPPLPLESRRSNTRAVKIIIVLVCALLVISGLGLFLIIRYIGASGITRPLDDKFGDQNLKSTVALLELHKIRYGRYPQSLRDIRFKGDWDEIWLNSTSYVVSPDGKALDIHPTCARIHNDI
jgi:hypothetical protein